MFYKGEKPQNNINILDTLSADHFVSQKNQLFSNKSNASVRHIQNVEFL